MCPGFLKKVKNVFFIPSDYDNFDPLDGLNDDVSIFSLNNIDKYATI